jgi:hypothetical protein
MWQDLDTESYELHSIADADLPRRAVLAVEWRGEVKLQQPLDSMNPVVAPWRYMNRKHWVKLVRSIPPGMSQLDAARYLNRKGSTVRYWLLKLKYRDSDGRRHWPERRKEKFRTINPHAVDWKQTNVAIAKQHGVSRERVRQLRRDLKLRKVKR